MPVWTSAGLAAGSTWRKEVSAPSKLDEHPGEGRLQRVLGQRLRTQDHEVDRALRSHLDHAGRLLPGVGVVLGRRDHHTATVAAGPDDPAVTQSGEEGAHVGPTERTYRYSRAWSDR